MKPQMNAAKRRTLPRSFVHPPLSVSIGVHLWHIGNRAMCDPALPMRKDCLGFVIGLGLLATRRWWRDSSGLKRRQSPSYAYSGR
jgi:hypothetical protein